MIKYRGVELEFRSFVFSALDGSEWSSACHSRFNKLTD